MEPQLKEQPQDPELPGQAPSCRHRAAMSQPHRLAPLLPLLAQVRGKDANVFSTSSKRLALPACWSTYVPSRGEGARASWHSHHHHLALILPRPMVMAALGTGWKELPAVHPSGSSCPWGTTRPHVAPSSSLHTTTLLDSLEKRVKIISYPPQNLPVTWLWGTAQQLK